MKFREKLHTMFGSRSLWVLIGVLILLVIVIVVAIIAIVNGMQDLLGLS